MSRNPIPKTHKLYIGGKFARTESGRTLKVKGEGGVVAHLCHASRKDFRGAVEAGRAAFKGWSGRTPYNRGQILYRMAEMLEGKREEFARGIALPMSGGVERALVEVDASVDRLVCYAGWTDKYAALLGNQNPVAAPFYNFTTAEPTGVVAVIAPDEAPLLALVSLLAPPLAAGNTVIALGSGAYPLATALLGEVAATSDVPAGVLNLLTGYAEELADVVATHRGVDGIHAAGCAPPLKKILEEGVAENLKRVRVRDVEGEGWFCNGCESPLWIEPFVEMKTIWHPRAL